MTEAMVVGPPLAMAGRINGLSLSGGAAEYIYETEANAFGDLGPQLGRAIRQRLNRLGVAVQEPEHLIRATLMGVAQYEIDDAGGTPVLAEPAAFASARERDAQLEVAGR